MLSTPDMSPDETDMELEAQIDAAYGHVINPELDDSLKRTWFLVMANLIRRRSPEQIWRMEQKLRLVRGGINAA